MAVRTDIAGIKNKRRVGVSSALPGTGSSHGKRVLPRDEATALRREIAHAVARPGPAARKAQPKDGRVETRVNGRKKAPSEMRVKHRGGPHKRLRIHGG
jgi:hypothetical protein